jgi:hypothetical protein
MDLAVRPAAPSDTAAWLRLLRGHLAYDPDTLARLPAAWRRLLRDEALIGAVIEDRERPAPARILGFGASVFVTDAFMQEARAGITPYLTARLVREELRGPSPVLRSPAIAEANAGDGLNVLFLHYCDAADALDQEELRRVRYQMLEACVDSHRGYRIKEVLQEIWDEVEPAYVRPGWGRLRTDYAGFYALRGQRLPPPGRGPYLIGLTREEVLAAPGSSVLAPLFVYSPPRLSLSRGERGLVHQALAGSTDAESTRALGIALPTVKSRWRAIYDRVAARLPELVSHPEQTPGTRGKEKRRRVLEYLRQHPEELRPFLGKRPPSRCRDVVRRAGRAPDLRR